MGIVGRWYLAFVAATFITITSSFTGQAYADAAVSIVGPSDGSTISGTVQFTCISNSSPVVFESLFVDSQYIASSPKFPGSGGFTFSSAFVTSSVANGAHTLICRGYNSANGTVGVATIGVIINNGSVSTPTPSSSPSPTPSPTPTPIGMPSVQITSPADGSTISGTVQFTCVSSSSQIVFESLFVDSSYIARSPTYPGSNGFTFTYPWSSANSANGGHTLICRGYNSTHGTVGIASVGVNINNASGPTPTPPASPTPSPTPTSVPTATPTRTPSPSPSATPTISPSATPTTTPTGASLTISPAVTTNKIARVGINMNYWTSWGAEQFSSNVIMNPGFEPTIDRGIVIVKSSSSTGFEDTDSWLGRANGFWQGGTFQVLTGQSAGISGAIANSAQSDSSGLPSYTTVGAIPELAVGDAIAVTQVQSAGPPANWWVGSSTQCALNPGDRPLAATFLEIISKANKLLGSPQNWANPLLRNRYI